MTIVLIPRITITRIVKGMPDWIPETIKLLPGVLKRLPVAILVCSGDGVGDSSGSEVGVTVSPGPGGLGGVTVSPGSGGLGGVSDEVAVTVGEAFALTVVLTVGVMDGFGQSPGQLI